MESSLKWQSRAIRTTLISLLCVAAPLSLYYMLGVVWWNQVFGIAGRPVMVFSLHGPLHSTVCFMGWALFYALAAVFPAWIFDVTKRMRAHTYLRTPFSPFRAAMAFFTPVQQIGLPYSIMRSLSFRAENRLANDGLLRFWWLSWILMFAGAVHYEASGFTGVFVPNWNLDTVLIYGGATLFCALSVPIVTSIERALRRGINPLAPVDRISYAGGSAEDVKHSSVSIAAGRPVGESELERQFSELEGVCIKLARQKEIA